MKMFINGKACDASSGETIEVTNPANGTVIDTVPAATPEDVASAVAYAKAAQKEWVKVPIHERVDYMMKFLDLVERDKEELARTLSNETGKPITEARAEIGNIPIAFKAFSERVKHLYDEVVPAGIEAGQEKTVLITRREPLGVVVAVIPFNFPCDLFDQKVAPALLSGNAVIVKPSTDNPLTLCMLTQLLGEAGVTPGAAQIVTGRGSVVGHELCANPDVDLVTLTGSTQVGIETAEVCAKDHSLILRLSLAVTMRLLLCLMPTLILQPMSLFGVVCTTLAKCAALPSVSWFIRMLSMSSLRKLLRRLAL